MSKNLIKHIDGREGGERGVVVHTARHVSKSHFCMRISRERDYTKSSMVSLSFYVFETITDLNTFGHKRRIRGGKYSNFQKIENQIFGPKKSFLVKKSNFKKTFLLLFKFKHTALSEHTF